MKYQKPVWPKKWIEWVENGTLYISVPFSWLLPKLRSDLIFRFKKIPIVVGGPAIKAFPDYLSGIDGVEVNTGDKKGVLQKFNPLAVKTTQGCIRNCDFCLVSKTEGKFVQFEEWLNLPIICDNNILASTGKHLEKVIDGLVEKWGWADFNGGIDVRILNKKQAIQIARVKDSIIRIALDDMKHYKKWLRAISLLKDAGVKKNHIRSYALVGFNTDVKEAWERCTFIEKNGILPLPMWYAPYNEMKKNKITIEQKRMGWNRFERSRFMEWFYCRVKKKVPFLEDINPERKGIFK